MKHLQYYTAYVLLVGTPVALLFGQPISYVFDACAVVAMPLHFHIGLRSVIIDYVDDVSRQKLLLGLLAASTVLTAVGLVKLSLTDIGLTKSVASLWVHQA